MKDKETVPGDDERFMQLVAMFQLAAMQQMGKFVNPVTNEVERDLEHARASIDMLETIERKTRGNLSDPERVLLEKVLFELRMNYVDEKRAGTGAETPDETPPTPEEESPREQGTDQ